jgi:hypothetical protein
MKTPSARFKLPIVSILVLFGLMAFNPFPAIRSASPPPALAVPFAGINNITHGVAGDERFVFVAQPLAGKVTVLNRFTGAEVGEIPPPPGGFKLPFTLRAPDSGKLVILDSGGFPSPTTPAIPVVYDYSYTGNPFSRSFHAQITRAVSFAGLPLFFTEDVETLPDGRYVVSESVLGGLWVIHPDGSIAPGITPAGFAPQDAIPGLGPGFLPQVQVGGIPFLIAGNFGPGVGSMAYHDGFLYFGNTALGGVRRVPVASLEDPTRLPHQRGADIQVVSPKPAGVTAEVIKGLTFNRWRPNDHRLVAADPFNLRLIRIDIQTGERETLAADPVLFNFPVAAHFLPPIAGIQSLVVVSDQEHRLAAINAAISTDMLQPPFIVTKVVLLR